MNSDFLRDLEALIRAHSGTQAPASEDRILKSISTMMTDMTRAIIAELRTSDRPGTMIRYRPDIDRGARPGTMIRYRPDIGRGERPGTMIRYRPDIGRGERPGTMIRYRPDWDRDLEQAVEGPDPQAAAAGFLEPMFRNLAERLGPEDAQRVISETLAQLGLSPAKSMTRTRRKPADKKPTS